MASTFAHNSLVILSFIFLTGYRAEVPLEARDAHFLCLMVTTLLQVTNSLWPWISLIWLYLKTVTRYWIIPNLYQCINQNVSPFLSNLISLVNTLKVHLKEGNQPNSWTDGSTGALHLPPQCTDFLHQSSLHRCRSADKTSGQQTAWGIGNERCNWKSNTAQGNRRTGSQGCETHWLGVLIFLSPFSWCQIETGGIQEKFIQN